MHKTTKLVNLAMHTTIKTEYTEGI